MKIKVSLFANLKKFACNGKTVFQVDLPNGATLSDLMQSLAVPDEVKRVALVNGRHAREDAALAQGDAVTVFPPFTGG